MIPASANATVRGAMNAAEFRPIAKRIQARWYAFQIPPSAMAQYVADLGDLGVDDVAAAVDSFATAAKPPTSGQVRHRVVEMQLDVPDWPAARSVLLRWRAGAAARVDFAERWACPAGVCDGSGFAIDDTVNDARDCECRPALLAARRGLHALPALVAEFVTAREVANGELDGLAEGNTTLDAQVRARWDAFTRRIVDSRVLAALPVAGSRDLQRVAAARAEDGGRGRSGLRRMDPVALLERGE